MKVLHLISGGDTGGAKTHIMSLFNSLDKMIDVKIICFIEDSFYYDAKAAGINIEVYEQKSRFDMSVVDKIVDQVKKEDYDIIHCHGARANFIGVFLKKKLNLPFVTTVHSDYKLDFKDSLYKKLIFTNLNLMALKQMDYYIAVSDAFKDMLVDRGFKKDKIYTVYNGIIIDQELNYKSREEFLAQYKIQGRDKTIVGIIARLDKVKDHESFLRGAKLALEKNPNMEFIIAGDGGERVRLEELSQELGLVNQVHFIGYITDVYSFYNAIDINTLTSVSESFPYAILEGALMEKPIVATRVGGLVKLIEDDENGYLINVGDYKKLGAILGELSQDPAKIKLLGKNLYNKVNRDYSSEEMAKGHVGIYEEILLRGKEVKK